MKITLRYSTKQSTYSPTSVYSKTIIILDKTHADTLLSHLNEHGIEATGLAAKLQDGIFSREDITNGELEDGAEYMLRGYDSIEMSEKLDGLFKTSIISTRWNYHL